MCQTTSVNHVLSMPTLTRCPVSPSQIFLPDAKIEPHPQALGACRNSRARPLTRQEASYRSWLWVAIGRGLLVVAARRRFRKHKSTSRRRLPPQELASRRRKVRIAPEVQVQVGQLGWQAVCQPPGGSRPIVHGVIEVQMRSVAWSRRPASVKFSLEPKSK